MPGCNCDFAVGDGCGGLGMLHCGDGAGGPCGGDQCICVCGGELPCPGCSDCEAYEHEGLVDEDGVR